MSAKRRAPPRPARAPKKPAPQLRRCSRCRAEKPVGEFPPNRGRADGLALYCRQCKREADRSTRRQGPVAATPEAWLGGEHPTPAPPGEERNPEPSEEPRRRAPALAITDELIAEAGRLIRADGVTRRACARVLGVSENTFKSWLREGAEAKSPDDPRARLLFEVESAEGDIELELTREYRRGARLDPQVAQRFLERRFSKGDEKWARTEHVEVTDGDKPPMEVEDARRALAIGLGKFLIAAVPPAPAGGGGAAGPVAVSGLGRAASDVADAPPPADGDAGGTPAAPAEPA